jgi:hypothetical protein
MKKFKGLHQTIRDNRLLFHKECHQQTKEDNLPQGHNLLNCKTLREVGLLRKTQSKTRQAAALFKNLYFCQLIDRAQVKEPKITGMQNHHDHQ